MEHKKLTLDQVPAQREVLVERIDSDGGYSRLMELGIVPGAQVKILFHSPGKNLAALFIDESFCLSLRNSDLSKIHVSILPNV